MSESDVITDQFTAWLNSPEVAENNRDFFMDVKRRSEWQANYRRQQEEERAKDKKLIDNDYGRFQTFSIRLRELSFPSAESASGKELVSEIRRLLASCADSCEAFGS